MFVTRMIVSVFEDIASAGEFRHEGAIQCGECHFSVLEMYRRVEP